MTMGAFGVIVSLAIVPIAVVFIMLGFASFVKEENK